jgi:membrane protein implicated in regulation of membrane protease activity
VRKTKEILEIVLFTVVIVLILSIIFAVVATFLHINEIHFMVIVVAILAVILAIIREFKESDTEHKHKENQLYENQLNREIVYFLHVYYPDKFYHDKLTDEDWSLYSLLTNVLDGAGFTAFYNEAHSKKLAKSLEESQMTYTKLYRKVKEELEKQRG